MLSSRRSVFRSRGRPRIVVDEIRITCAMRFGNLFVSELWVQTKWPYWRIVRKHYSTPLDGLAGGDRRQRHSGIHTPTHGQLDECKTYVYREPDIFEYHTERRQGEFAYGSMNWSKFRFGTDRPLNTPSGGVRGKSRREQARDDESGGEPVVWTDRNLDRRPGRLQYKCCSGILCHYSRDSFSLPCIYLERFFIRGDFAWCFLLGLRS